ncbi:hypothetical protein HXX76_004110 [Chlamydomonas incerta]|uniref:Uncharacterized protein n=1 Tax=Chlamydomonas incerta TaxID=51695 RepID=A0A835W798_CHLIN|nr:hypothetical protein HXX76_004110 [Chlamydomonas incerta]|eukprot:KAG2439993.1 hypothetical protein HXX76_004110 [Chlamydomonas incerta]
MAAPVDLEEQKKMILPFMQRAQEIQAADPKVAYYCRLYAVEQAMKLTHRAKEVNSLLVATLNQLEKDKAKLELDPAADRIHCLGFALRIFDNADRVDRAGRATERTSKAFYAASVFIEILNQFEGEGGVDAELFDKQRYCAWRAAEIRKALREGRQPTPPPAATPPPPAAGTGPDGSSGGAGGGSGGGGLDDLPPASGSSDWAYRSAAPTAPPPPPPGPAYAPDVHMPPPPPPPSASDFSFAALPLTPPAASSASSSYSSGSAPPSAPLFGSPPGSGGGAGGGGGGGARFWPGARVLVRADESEGLSALSLSDHSSGDHQAQQGTVGQVLTRPDGGTSYKVALRDRLVELRDEEAVPALGEGQAVALYRGARPGGPLGPATPVAVVLINDASWPPTYLVKTQDGDELAASASQLGPPLPAAAAAAAGPPSTSGGPGSISTALPPPPPLPPADLLGGHYVGGPASASTSTSSNRSAAAPPPPPPHYQQPPPPPSGPPSSSSAYPSMSGDGSYGAPPGPSAPPPPQPYGYGAPPSAPSAPPPPSWPGAQHSAPAAPAPAPPAPAPAAATYSLPPGYKPPLTVITEAQKAAKYAVSALSFEDVHTAVRYLNDALRLLTTQQQPPQQHAPGRR